MKLNASEVWKRYLSGSEHHSKSELYLKTEKAYRFYAGDQWYDTAGGKDLPVMNIIAPIVEYKVATVARNKVDIVYTPMNNDENRQLYQKLCDKLSDYTLSRWERANMDDVCWHIVKNAAITGESYLYFPDDEQTPQVIDNVNIYFGDEQQSDIQKQPYIIIFERSTVEAVKAAALKNGIDKKLIDRIRPDDEKTGALNAIPCRISPLGYIITDHRGTAAVNYERGYEKISPDDDDGKVLELDEESACLLPLLAAFYVWQDDDERKAVRYRNDYESLKAQFLSKRTDHAVINAGDDI